MYSKEPEGVEKWISTAIWLLIMVTVVWLLFQTEDAHAKRLFLGDFESPITGPLSGKNNAFSVSTMKEDCSAHAWEYKEGWLMGITKEAALYGDKGGHMRIKWGCDYRWANGGEVDPENGYLKPRGAYAINDPKLYWPVNEVRWFRFAIGLPADIKFETNQYNEDSIMQLSKPSKGASNNKNTMNVHLIKDQLYLQHYHSSGGLSDKVKQVKLNTVKGGWNDILIQARWCRPEDSNCDGFINVWANGDMENKIYEHKGVNHVIGPVLMPRLNLYKYNHVCQPGGGPNDKYPGPLADARLDFPWCTNQDKNGNWQGRAETVDKGIRSIYVDQIVIGDADSSFEEMVPEWFDEVVPPEPEFKIPQQCIDNPNTCFITVPLNYLQ